MQPISIDANERTATETSVQRFMELPWLRRWRLAAGAAPLSPMRQRSPMVRFLALDQKRAPPAVAARSYRATLGGMAATQKISVAMGRNELRLAKAAAEAEGLSLSAYATRAVRDRLEEGRRIEAAREFLATLSSSE